MREQLIAYIDTLFVGTDDSQTARDCRDELLQNTLDRYEEELAAGKTAEEAYRLAVLSIGDTEELLKPFYPKRENTAALRGIAVALYCTAVVPVILLGVLGSKFAAFGVALMFLMIAGATALMILSGRSKSTKEARTVRSMRALGVGLIISSLAGLMLGVTYEELRVIRLIPVDGAVYGVCLMFMLIAAGIAVLVAAGQKHGSRSVPEVPVAKEPPARETPAAAPQTQPVMRPAVPKWVRIVGGILTGFYWLFATLAFIWLSVSAGSIFYSWLVFVVAAGIYSVVRGFVRLCCGVSWLSMVTGGLITLLAAWAYIRLTDLTQLWYVTWLVFPIAGCLNGVVNGIIRLVRSSKWEGE